MTLTAIEAETRAGAHAALPDRVMLNPSAATHDGRIRYRVRDGERVRVLGITVTGTVRALTALAGLGPLPASALIRELAVRTGGEDTAQRTVRSAVDCGLLIEAEQNTETDVTTPDPFAGAEKHTSTRPPLGYESAFADLARVARFGVLFDRAHDTRALLTVAFTDRFGAGGRASLVDAAADLLSVAGRRARMLDGRTCEDFGPADGSLAELLRLRAAARQALDGWFRPAGTVDLDPARLAGLAADLPARFATAPTVYRVLAEPHGGSLAALAFDAVPAVHAHQGPSTAEQWCRVQLVHRPDTDTLVLIDGDGGEFAVRGAGTGIATGTGRPGGLPAPLLAAAWISGAGLMVDPYAGAVARLRGRDGAAAEVDPPRVTAGRVVLGSGARDRPARPSWLVDCGGAAPCE